ncbi:MAG: ABC transporter permease [Myxococcota bacterium]
MQNLLTIAGRQFRSYFNGAIAYIVVCFLLLVVGFFFWETFFLYRRATAREFFSLFSLLNYLALPALTMGLLAEEKRTGTIELLITMPVADWQVILGKFLGVYGLYCVVLLLTLPYPISIAQLGDLDWGPVFAGYTSLLLQGGAILALGLMASSLTDNQLIALFVTWGFTIVFFLIDKFLPLAPLSLTSFLEFVSFDAHLESMRRGVVAVRDLVFFKTVTILSLMVAFRALESRRWS